MNLTPMCAKTIDSKLTEKNFPGQNAKDALPASIVSTLHDRNREHLKKTRITGQKIASM